jgi:hypothetical protein
MQASDDTRIPTCAADGLVHVVIDTPQGSRNKYKDDDELGQFFVRHNRRQRREFNPIARRGSQAAERLLSPVCKPTDRSDEPSCPPP